MGSFVPAEKVVRCVHLDSDAEGHTAQVRFYLQYDGLAPSSADLVALAGSLETSWETEMQPWMAEQWASAGAVCTDLTSEFAAQGEVGGSGTGALTGGGLPASVCGVVSQPSTRRIRGGHSRVYLAVGDATKVLNAAHWTVSFVPQFTNAWSNVISETAAAIWTSGGTFTQVVPSFFSGYTNVPYGVPTKYRRVPTPRATAAIYPVLDLVGKSLIGSQRRRLLS